MKTVSDIASYSVANYLYFSDIVHAMNCTNLETIKDHFVDLISKLRTVFVGVEVAEVRQYLIDQQRLPSNVSTDLDLKAIFDHLSSTKPPHWTYQHYDLVEKLDKRFLQHDNKSIKPHIMEYKAKRTGYLAAKKIIESEFFRMAESDDSEEVVHAITKYGHDDRQVLKMKLKLGSRRLSHLSLIYVAELWTSFADEYELPSITAVIDHIVEHCLEIAWLILPGDAEKIKASVPSHTAFFQERMITLVTIDDYTVYKIPNSEVSHADCCFMCIDLYVRTVLVCYGLHSAWIYTYFQNCVHMYN